MYLFCHRSQPELQLRFSGERNGGKLINGAIFAGQLEVGRVNDGVAAFVERSNNWPSEAKAIEELRSAGQLGWSWKNGISRGQGHPVIREWCDVLAAVDGVVLEVAAGPDGGNLAPVLDRNPAARLLVNDVWEGLLALWSEFLAERQFPNVCLAAFDARDMPIRDARVAAVSSQLGFGSIEGARCAMGDAYRVLVPGGLLLSMNFLLDPADWARMPQELAQEWEKRLPGLVLGEANLLRETGFAIESCEVMGGRALDPDEGGLPKEAAGHGIQLHVCYEYVRARKPAE